MCRSNEVAVRRLEQIKSRDDKLEMNEKLNAKPNTMVQKAWRLGKKNEIDVTGDVPFG